MGSGSHGLTTCLNKGACKNGLVCEELSLQIPTVQNHPTEFLPSCQNLDILSSLDILTYSRLLKLPYSSGVNMLILISRLWRDSWSPNENCHYIFPLFFWLMTDFRGTQKTFVSTFVLLFFHTMKVNDDRCCQNPEMHH